MKRTDDIMLDSRLKENAFMVPEGYFESLPSKLKEKRKAAGKTSLAGRLVPYLAIAASFAAIAVVGSAILRKTVPAAQEEISFESYYSQLANQEISDEDVVNYLLCCGVSTEQISEFAE